MWYSYEGPRVFWLNPGETSAQARDPFISVQVRSHVGISRHILRLPVGKHVTLRQDHLCSRPWSCRMATHSCSVCQGGSISNSRQKKKQTRKNSRWQLQICTAMPIKHQWQTITGRPCFENIISVACSHAAARSNCLPCATQRLLPGPLVLCQRRVGEMLR